MLGSESAAKRGHAMNDDEHPAEFLNSHRELMDLPMIEPDAETDRYDNSERIIIILAIYLLAITALASIGWAISRAYG